MTKKIVNSDDFFKFYQKNKITLKTFVPQKSSNSAWLIQKRAEIMRHLMMSHRQRWFSNSDVFDTTMTFWKKKKNVMVEKLKMWYFIDNHDTCEKKRHGLWKWLITENLTFFGPTMAFFMIFDIQKFWQNKFCKFRLLTKKIVNKYVFGTTMTFFMFCGIIKT